MQLIIENSGQEINSTNFWETPYNTRGLFYLSFNAGASRLLVPDPQVNLGAIDEIRTGEWVEISRDKNGKYRLIFEDRTEAPYSLDLDPRHQMDRVPDKASGDIPFRAYSSRGQFYKSILKFKIKNNLTL